jgi:hypothetical protein
METGADGADDAFIGDDSAAATDRLMRVASGAVFFSSRLVSTAACTCAWSILPSASRKARGELADCGDNAGASEMSAGAELSLDVSEQQKSMRTTTREGQRTHGSPSLPLFVGVVMMSG